VGEVISRAAQAEVSDLLNTSSIPVFLHADGGVGKTVFVQSIALEWAEKYEVVVFDCFGGGAYRSEDQGRHLPKVGLLQIVNELAARGLCDPKHWKSTKVLLMTPI
jgi:FtsP/CotA-like multicopper oxidase with cupredoxin domain